MLLELGRGPVEFNIITVATALDEKFLDLEIGARGFRLQDRVSAAALRVSSIKGEVKKAITADPKPKFWTIPAGTHFESILGIRVMQEDAMHGGESIDYDDVKDGVMLEQRWYFTSEADDTDIELIIIPGT